MVWLSRLPVRHRQHRFLTFLLSALLWPVATGPGAPEAAYGSPDKREQEREDTGNRQDGPQALLRGGLLGAALRLLREGDARELVYEAPPEKAADDSQEQRNYQCQERHQEAVLEARARRHPSRGVAADQEGQE